MKSATSGRVLWGEILAEQARDMYPREELSQRDSPKAAQCWSHHTCAVAP